MVRFELSEVIQSVEQLRELVAKGKRLKFLFFWGHTAPANGTINQACLSQWWPSSFEIDEVIYPTAEHFMMASKARLFGDTATWHRILACGHPKQRRNLGDKWPGLMRRNGCQNGSVSLSQATTQSSPRICLCEITCSKRMRRSSWKPVRTTASGALAWLRTTNEP